MPLQYPSNSPYNPYQQVGKPKNWPLIILIALAVVIVGSVVVYFVVNNSFNGSGGEYPVVFPTFDCSKDVYNCANFTTYPEAQGVFDYCIKQGKGDIHRLDADGNGKACESLP